jgi:hypothetical protein
LFVKQEEREMDKSRLIGGMICVALALLLALLAYTLPEDKMMFMVGDENMPIVPAIGLGIIGLVLLATAGWGRQAEAPEGVEQARKEAILDEEKAALNKRLETIAWGLFLIMLGGFLLVPHEIIAGGFWSIGVGVIMLGLNLARYFFEIKMSGFTTVLGIISLVSGVLQVAGMDFLEGAIFLIILGAYVLLKPWFDKRQLFGKAEEA